MCRAGKKRKGRGFGTCILSEPLAKFMGTDRAPRTEVLPLLWLTLRYSSHSFAGHCQSVQAELQLTPSLLSSKQSQLLVGQNMALHTNTGHTCCIWPLQ